jgi:hypothetical protein
MRRVLAGFVMALFAVVAIATAPQALATPDDDFLSALSAAGLSVPAKVAPQVIQGGHTVCSAWAGGASYGDTVKGVVGATGGNQGMASLFVRTATKSLCPSYASKLP